MIPATEIENWDHVPLYPDPLLKNLRLVSLIWKAQSHDNFKPSSDITPKSIDLEQVIQT